MIQAKRAIILAAGFGSRLREITVKTPKPLITVKGRMFIETIIDALTQAGIYDITIVVGYKAEQFYKLKKKYPFVKFIINEHYSTCNNISSLYVARHLLEDCYIFEADLYIANPKIISKTIEQSCYLGYYTEQTNDWCAKLNQSGKICYFGIGGMEAYETKGISFFSKADGQKLRASLEATWSDPDGKTKLWDDCVFNEHNHGLLLGVKEISKTDVIEVDTLQELILLDKKYSKTL